MVVVVGALCVCSCSAATVSVIVFFGCVVVVAGPFAV